MTRVRLEIVTMAGAEYVLWEEKGAFVFPHGELADGEAPADAARRIVRAWSKTEAPKLEMADILSAPGELTLVLRALLVSEPQGATKRVKRMELPERVGTLTGKYVEDALKTSLAYKLTRA